MGGHMTLALLKFMAMNAQYTNHTLGTKALCQFMLQVRPQFFTVKRCSDLVCRILHVK